MKKQVVLIVDDEQDVRNTITGFLQLRYDCEYFEAKDGEEAVVFAANKPCDVIILDVKMPKKSGIDVIKEVKKSKPAIDILMVSSWFSEDVSDEAMEEGATDYVLKPLDLKVIAMKFEKILRSRGYDLNMTSDSE